MNVDEYVTIYRRDGSVYATQRVVAVERDWITTNVDGHRRDFFREGDRFVGSYAHWIPAGEAHVLRRAA